MTEHLSEAQAERKHELDVRSLAESHPQKGELHGMTAAEIYAGMARYLLDVRRGAVKVRFKRILLCDGVPVSTREPAA